MKIVVVELIQVSEYFLKKYEIPARRFDWHVDFEDAHCFIEKRNALVVRDALKNLYPDRQFTVEAYWPNGEFAYVVEHEEAEAKESE